MSNRNKNYNKNYNKPVTKTFHNITNKLNPQQTYKLQVFNKTFSFECDAAAFVYSTKMLKLLETMEESVDAQLEFFEALDDFFLVILGEEQEKELRKLHLTIENKIMVMMNMTSIIRTGDVTSDEVDNEFKKNSQQTM